MTKKEARNIAVRWLWNTKNLFHESMSKYSIDDIGTQSESGYEEEDYDKIEKEVDWLLEKILKYEIK